MENPVTPIEDDSIDFAKIWLRLRQGLPRTIGLGLIGLALGALGYIVAYPANTTRTTSRVVFSFPGFERGQYPDKSKFQAEDLIAPDIVDKALGRIGLTSSSDIQGDIRSSLTVEGIIPTAVVTERDRMRNAGQNPPPYVPDEYRLTLALKRKFALSSAQRERLLHEIVMAYRERFTKNFVELPQSFGSAFQTLKSADFFEYEIVLNDEISKVQTFLAQQAELAKSFRSPTTNLTYADLISQTQLFTQIQLNAALGMIRINGISQDRAMAMVKMDYYLRMLDERELKAQEEAKVVTDLLEKTQQRAQNYVLGIKSAAQTKTDNTVVDQGLLDSLLANDANNFLVRRALEAGLAVKRLQAEKATLAERRKNMESFVHSGSNAQASDTQKLTATLGKLEQDYNNLMQNIRATHTDYARQLFADAARESMEPHTESYYRSVAETAAMLGAIGIALGLGLSLVGPALTQRD